MFQTRFEHVFLPLFGKQVKHDPKSCSHCLKNFGQLPLDELPLHRQDFILPLTCTRFAFFLSESKLQDNFQQDFEDCFKIDLVRKYCNDSTSLVTSQELFDKEINTLSNHVKSQNHVFIYLNVWRNVNKLINLHKNCQVWILLDFKDAHIKWELEGLDQDNIVAIALKNGSLQSCFSSITRETLSTLVDRLKLETKTDVYLYSNKNTCNYFGFE